MGTFEQWRDEWRSLLVEAAQYGWLVYDTSDPLGDRLAGNIFFRLKGHGRAGIGTAILPAFQVRLPHRRAVSC